MSGQLQLLAADGRPFMQRSQGTDVNLRQYNEILWACIGTIAVLGAVALAVVLAGSGLFSDGASAPQVDLREPEAGVEAPDHNLVLCLPTIISASNTYLIGATVVDAREPASRTILGSGSRYDQRSSPECTLAGQYGTSSQLQNVLVLDLETGRERMLLPHRALIQRFASPHAQCHDGTGIAPCDHLYWELRPADSSGDGTIDAEDAAVAYLSDLRASRLIRISPEESHLVSASRDSHRSMILMQIQSDSNDDSVYTAADSVELFEYAIGSEGGPEPLVSPEASAAVSKLLLP